MAQKLSERTLENCKSTQGLEYAITALIGAIGCLTLLAYMICSHKAFNSAVLAITESIFGGPIIVIFSYYFKVEGKKPRIPMIALALGILALIIGGLALYRTFYSV